MKFFDKLRYSLARKLYGSYGIDQLGRFLSFLVTFMLIISIFLHNLLFYLLVLVLMILMYVRVFSKNYDQRRRENAIFLRAVTPFRRFFSDLYLKVRDRKTYRYFYCPSCRQRLRVPKGKGKITVRCPKCATKFDART